MVVPEAAMDQDHLPEQREHEVGGTGQVPSVQTEPETETVGQPANGHLWTGVLSTNARHQGRRRAVAAGILAPIGNHTFRATSITAYLSNGGALEHAQAMAAHESPRTTKLYDRTKERLTQDEVERIRL